MNRRTSATLALLLLAILGFILWPRDTDPPAGSDRRTASSPGQSTQWSSGSSQTPSKLPRRATEHQSSHATHAPEELRNFIIPTLTTRNATVDDALTALFEQYNEICRNTGETPLKFSYRINGTPHSKLDLNLKQTPFLRALRIIAARSGLALDRDGTELVFSAVQLKPADELVSSSLPVPPTFKIDLYSISRPPSDPSDEIPLIQDIPIIGELFAPPLIDTLRQLGVVRSSDANVAFLAETSTLTLNASPADQARLTAFLNEEFLDVRPVQLKTTTKVVDSPEPLTFNATRFNDAEFQNVMRTLTQTKGVAIQSQPGVASRPGQAATVEVIREVILPNPNQEGEFTADWTGVKTLINAGGYGFDLQSSITQESRVALGDSPDSIEGVKTAGTQQFPAGSTVLIESTTPQGTPRYIFTTTQRLDAAGRPYDPRDPNE